jgi:hypothetical protein
MCSYEQVFIIFSFAFSVLFPLFFSLIKGYIQYQWSDYDAENYWSVSDIKHTMMLPIKIIMSVLNFLTYIMYVEFSSEISEKPWWFS